MTDDIHKETGDSTGVAIIDINREIKTQLADVNVQNALLATTFKGLDVTRMKQALLEGMIRGFKFQDFLKKDVYALPFGTGYSIVQAIDYNRKIGMRSGIVGTKKPVYVTVENIVKDEKTGAEIGKTIDIVSCEVTVLKKFEDGYVGEFTAEVFFDEYYKKGKEYNGKYTPSMWDTKPRTMIAKVAEMHALRKACPEQLAQSYIEEEFDKEIATVDSSPKGRMNRAKSESTTLSMGSKVKDDEKDQNKTTTSESVETEVVEDEDVQGGGQ